MQIITKGFYRDVASRNCLVNAARVVKLGDFGMTRPMFDKDYYKFSRRGKHHHRRSTGYYLKRKSFLYYQFCALVCLIQFHLGQNRVSELTKVKIPRRNREYTFLCVWNLKAPLVHFSHNFSTLYRWFYLFSK